MKTPEALMIFAAGLGTRMGALTRDVPKPLLRVAGKALIDHALDQADAVAPQRTVVNVHHHAGQIRQHLARRPVKISDETAALLDTGGGLRHALSLLGQGPVYTLNSDAVWRGPNPLTELRDAWDPAVMDGLVLLVQPHQALGHTGGGDFALDASARITRGGALVYTGAQIIRTEDLPGFADTAFSLNRLWDILIGRGRLYGVVYSGQWCDAGSPDGLVAAEDMLSNADDV